MSEQKHSPETIAANIELLHMFSDDKRHHEESTMNIMLVFMSANAGLLAAIDLLARTLGPVPLGFLGLASVVVSVFSTRVSRRWWQRAMHEGFKVQRGLIDMGVHLLARPFGDSPARARIETTVYAHVVVAAFWVGYLACNYNSLTELAQKVLNF